MTDRGERAVPDGIRATPSRRPAPVPAGAPQVPPRPAGTGTVTAPPRTRGTQPAPLAEALVNALTGPISDRPLRDAPAAPAAPVVPAAADVDPESDDAPRQPDPMIEAVHADERFRELRARQRRFVLTATPLFLSWYGLFVVLSAYAPSVMRTPVIGSVNAGMLLGLAQFVSTLAIVAVYGRFARRELDPRVDALRATYTPTVVPQPVRVAPPVPQNEVWSSR